MARQKKQNSDETLRHAVEQHLRYREQVASPLSNERHLDEDSLAAFVQGCLSQTESAPLISHLVACGFCRHATAQLIRLESELGETEAVHTLERPEPGRIRRLLESLAARVLPQTDEEAVFAYHAPADDAQQQAEKSTNSEPSEAVSTDDAKARETND